MPARGPRAASAARGRSELNGLLADVAGGDHAAFAALYDVVAGPVYGLALRVVRDPARAEEVAHEALLDVWRGAGRFDPQRVSGLGYILAITHRLAVDLVRREQSGKGEKRVAVLPELSYDVVVAAVTGRCERDEVRRCLTSLTDVQREALTLAYYDGYTYAEVADLLEVKPATAKARIRDGLLRLHTTLLEPDEPPPPLAVVRP